MTETVTPNVSYAVKTTTVEFYDSTKNEGRGGYLSVAELKDRIAEGKPVRPYSSFSRTVNSLEDAKILLRAAELGAGNDPYDLEENRTRIVTRTIVKMEEVA